MPRVEDLVSEISQIMEQYRREIPGKQSRLPFSVKERVRALQRLGLNAVEIAQRTGLAYHTILRWREGYKKSGFGLVKVTDGKPSTGSLISKVDTATVLKRAKNCKVDIETMSNHNSTVCVVTPSGIRIEGVNETLLLKLVPELGVWR